MDTYFFSVYLFNPNGQSSLANGQQYGGEAMFFVLASESLNTAATELIEEVEASGSTFLRIVRCASTSEFEEADFPFEFDLDAMVADAKARDGIFAVGPFTFRPLAETVEPVGVFFGEIEVFNSIVAVEESKNYAAQGGYGGQYQSVLVKGEIIADALKILVSDLAENQSELISIEGFFGVENYDFDGFADGFEETDPMAAAGRSLKPVYGISYCYPVEDEVSE